MIFTIHVNKSKKYIYNHEVKKNGRKNKIQEHVLVYMDQDMIEFYLTYKQNQSYNYNMMKKIKNPIKYQEK
jgi:hypothetical protein